MGTDGPTSRVSLHGYAVFAAMLSAAGLPIYIHAPAYYATTYGVGLTALAGVLFALRLIDVVQDPLLGWLSARLNARTRDRGGGRRRAAGGVDAGPLRGNTAGRAPAVVRDNDGRAVLGLLVPHDLHVCRGRAAAGSLGDRGT
jgi:hypothetical protein